MQTYTQQDEERRYANTILDQIGKWGRMSLGVRNALILNESETRRGGVRFHVGRGNWLVEIDLTFADLYDVRFMTRKSGRVGYEASGVYCDQLAEVLLFGADKCNV